MAPTNSALKIALHGGRVNRGWPKSSFFFDKLTRIRLYGKVCMVAISRYRLGIHGILIVRYRTGNDYRRTALFCLPGKNEVLDSKNSGDSRRGAEKNGFGAHVPGPIACISGQTIKFIEKMIKFL